MSNHMSILPYIWETYNEKLLNYKCNELLNYYSKERLIENCKYLSFFNTIFINNIMSIDDVNFALLKKYYIGGFVTKNSNIINGYIDVLDFDGANLELTRNNKLRSELLNVYLENLHISNTELCALNSYVKNYNDFCATISAMDKYYKDLKQSSTSKIYSLKKEL